MNTLDIFLVVLLSLNVISSIALIGSPRKPYSKVDAVWVLIVDAALIAWIVLL